jgi:outer membrane receptor protein involved in Fe transport
MTRVWGVIRGGLMVVAAVGIGAPVRAQEPDTILVQEPEIVVHALRGDDRLRDIPAAAFVVTRPELARHAEARLSSILQFLPGLYGYQSSASGEPTVVDPRGFTANGETSYLKVLINGRDTRDLENGNVDWDWVSPLGADRLEVVEGPGSWAWGDGAEGGIVNIVRDEAVAGLHPRATFRGGSFDQKGGGAGVTWGDERWTVAASGMGRDVDGWRDNSRERARSGHALTGWRPAERTSLTLDGSWLSTDRQDPGALTPDQIAVDRTQAENPGDHLNSERELVGLTMVHGDATTQRWTLAPYARFEDFEQVRTLFVPLLHPTNGSTWGTDLGWRGAIPVAGRTLQLGAGYEIESAALRTRYYDWNGTTQGALLARGEAKRLTQAGYVHAQLPLGDRLTAHAGLRGDAARVEFHDKLAGGDEGPRTLSALSPFGALTASLGRTTLYVSGSGGFHAPTLNQLYDRRPIPTGAPPPFPAFITISNGDLEPQRSAGYEVGARWDGAAGQAGTITFYDVFVNDEIDFDLGSFQYANIGKSRHTGVTAGTRWPLPQHFAVIANGTVSPTTIRSGDLDGNQINAVPKGSAIGRLEWSGLSWLDFDAGVRWVATQFLDKENQHPLGEYATVDLGASFHVRRARLDVRVLNLLDREYSDTGFIGPFGEERLIPAAGRSVVAALSLE